MGSLLYASLRTKISTLLLVLGCQNGNKSARVPKNGREMVVAAGEVSGLVWEVRRMTESASFEKLKLRFLGFWDSFYASLGGLAGCGAASRNFRAKNWR